VSELLQFPVPWLLAYVDPVAVCFTFLNHQYAATKEMAMRKTVIAVSFPLVLSIRDSFSPFLMRHFTRFPLMPSNIKNPSPRAAFELTPKKPQPHDPAGPARLELVNKVSWQLHLSPSERKYLRLLSYPRRIVPKLSKTAQLYGYHSSYSLVLPIQLPCHVHAELFHVGSSNRTTIPNS